MKYLFKWLQNLFRRIHVQTQFFEIGMFLMLFKRKRKYDWMLFYEIYTKTFANLCFWELFLLLYKYIISVSPKIEERLRSEILVSDTFLNSRIFVYFLHWKKKSIFFNLTRKFFRIQNSFFRINYYSGKHSFAYRHLSHLKKHFWDKNFFSWP